MPRIIAHLDADAFFAAIEERDSPRLKGLPIVIGADPKSGFGRGVVSTASYAARKYGIHSAMPISKAYELSEKAFKGGNPRAVFLEVNGKKYGQVSRRIMEIIRSEVQSVEEASIDEAYMDLSFTENFDEAGEFAQKIKSEIFNKENLTVSIGIGPNKLIAKIASDFQKPNGLTIVKPKKAEEFLENLAIRKIPGIGPKTELMFLKDGVRIVKDLKKYSREELVSKMGKWGGDLYKKIRGEDNSPLVEEYEPKSVGEQETFEIDTKDSETILRKLRELSQGAFARFLRNGFKFFKAVGITVRFQDFETKTKIHTLPEQASSEGELIFEATKLLMPFLDSRENPKSKKIRLLGVRMEKLQ